MENRNALIAEPPSLTYIAAVFQVTDLSRSLAFYRDQLGFTVEFVYEGFYAGVCRDNCRIHLKCATHSTDHTGDREESIDVCIGVQSVESLSANFAAVGVSFVVPLREMPYGTEFYVHDPDGYVLGFIQPATEFQNRHDG